MEGNEESITGYTIDSESTYVLAEYSALRDEINNLNNLASSMLQVSVAASFVLIGYIQGSESSKISLLLFPAPFLLMIPSLFIILSRFQAIMRISGYIRVFLEKEERLGYEKRYVQWLNLVSASGDRIGFTFRETIFYLYLSLGLLSIGIFYSKGFTYWSDMILYLTPTPFYFYAYRLVNQNWREIYDKYWRKVKEEELHTKRFSMRYVFSDSSSDVY